MLRDSGQGMPVGSHAEFYLAVAQIRYNFGELGVENVFASPHANGANLDRLADFVDLFQGNVIDAVRISITMCTIQVTVIGQPYA
jgi:hypothetical protein